MIHFSLHLYKDAYSSLHCLGEQSTLRLASRPRGLLGHHVSWIDWPGPAGGINNTSRRIGERESKGGLKKGWFWGPYSFPFLQQRAWHFCVLLPFWSLVHAQKVRPSEGFGAVDPFPSMSGRRESASTCRIFATAAHRTPCGGTAKLFCSTRKWNIKKERQKDGLIIDPRSCAESERETYHLW